MSELTPNLKLFKYNTETDAKQPFSINDCMNANWDKIDASLGSLEICDIGMALYVDESKGKRRYLNGQIVDRNANTEAFFTRLKDITTLYPSLLCTEEEWQTAKTMSAFGQVGKFVFNYSGNKIVSVRIPRVVNIQGLFDLQNLGMTVEAGLPNITGEIDSIRYGGATKNATGAFASSTEFDDNLQNFWANTKNSDAGKLNFNANNSNSIYGNSDTIQEEAIQYPYFIQIATGSETENNIVNDIELNNPHSLFDSKYSDHELNNLSWLKSEGQWNAKAVYTDAYDKLLKVYNGTETVEGLSVKLSTETYTDYDFVLNTANETFRLPLLDGSEDLPSSYNILTFPNLVAGASTVVVDSVPRNGWYRLQLSAGISSFQDISLSTSSGGLSVCSAEELGVTLNAEVYAQKGDKVYAYINNTTYTPRYFGFRSATGNGSLYFYVGETVQNANLIDAGRIGEQLAGLTTVVETYQNGTSGYRIWSDGYCEQWGLTSAVGGGGSVKVSLLKSYVNVDYTITLASYGSYTAAGEANDTVSTLTKSSFIITSGYIASQQKIWKTCGYIK